MRFATMSSKDLPYRTSGVACLHRTCKETLSAVDNRPKKHSLELQFKTSPRKKHLGQNWKRHEKFAEHASI